MIRMFHAYSETGLPDAIRQTYSQVLPDAVRNRIDRYQRRQDREAVLLGKIILLHGLAEYGFGPDCLEKLCYNDYGRPFLDETLDFNISHSGGHAVCAITESGQVGIDIEVIRPISLADFEQFLSPAEWSTIKEADDPQALFFSYWTIKESVLKALGKGLSVPLRQVEIAADRKSVVLDGHQWFIHEIPLGPGRTCHVTVSLEPTEINVNRLNPNAIDVT